MRIMLNTILAIAFIAAAYQVVWSVKKHAVDAGKPVQWAEPDSSRLNRSGSSMAPPTNTPVHFDDAYQRYVEHLVHTKYADRIPLEEERVKRHLSIIKEQLEVQQRILEEARRP